MFTKRITLDNNAEAVSKVANSVLFPFVVLRVNFVCLCGSIFDITTKSP